MGNQGDTHVFQRLIASPLEWRYKDQIRIHTHDNLVIEISLYTDLCGFTFFQAFVHLFIEQMPCTGNPNDLIQGTQFNKIR